MMFHLLYEATPLRLGKVAIYSNAQKQKQKIKESDERGEFFFKGQDKT